MQESFLYRRNKNLRELCKRKKSHKKNFSFGVHVYRLREVEEENLCVVKQDTQVNIHLEKDYLHKDRQTDRGN